MNQNITLNIRHTWLFIVCISLYTYFYILMNSQQSEKAFWQAKQWCVATKLFQCTDLHQTLNSSSESVFLMPLVLFCCGHWWEKTNIRDRLRKWFVESLRLPMRWAMLVLWRNTLKNASIEGLCLIRIHSKLYLFVHVCFKLYA